MRMDEREDRKVGEEGKCVYDQKDKSFDFHFMKATNIFFNKRICLLESLNTESEINIQTLKVKLNQNPRLADSFKK